MRTQPAPMHSAKPLFPLAVEDLEDVTIPVLRPDELSPVAPEPPSVSHAPPATVNMQNSATLLLAAPVLKLEWNRMHNGPTIPSTM